MDLEQHLIDLSDAAGPSGFEGPVREILKDAWQGLADTIETDVVGNLVALRRGGGSEPRRRAMVTAHMDEIGLMVDRIDGAFLRVISLWGVDRRTLLNQPVIVHGERPLPGLIGSRPPHVLPQSERGKFQAIPDLVVDTGLPERELRKLVPIGSPVSIDQHAIRLNSGLVTGKALDNRASTAALTAILEGLSQRPTEWDVEVTATVQEENNHTGIITSAWRTRPDLALVIDTTWAVGVGVSEDRGYKMGDGPLLAIGPNAHPKLFELVREAAERHEIPLGVEPMTGRSGTDGWFTQISREGIPTAILSIPIRSMHTPAEIVALKDIERAARLAVEVVAALDEGTLGRLALDEEAS